MFQCDLISPLAVKAGTENSTALTCFCLFFLPPVLYSIARGDLAAALALSLRFGQSTSWSTRAFCPKSPGLVRSGGWLSGAELAACWCLVVHWCWPHGRATERARGSRRAPSPGGHVPPIVRREPPIPGRQKITRPSSSIGAGGEWIPKVVLPPPAPRTPTVFLISGRHVCCLRQYVGCGGRVPY